MRKYVKIKGVSSRVEKMLTEIPRLREDDRILLIEIWKEDLEKAGYRIDPLLTFFEIFREGTLTNPESVRRSRQQLQQKDESLRGKNYGKRMKHKTKIEEELGYQTKMF